MKSTKIILLNIAMFFSLSVYANEAPSPNINFDRFLGQGFLPNVLPNYSEQEAFSSGNESLFKRMININKDLVLDNLKNSTNLSLDNIQYNELKLNKDYSYVKYFFKDRESIGIYLFDASNIIKSYLLFDAFNITYSLSDQELKSIIKLDKVEILGSDKNELSLKKGSLTYYIKKHDEYIEQYGIMSIISENKERFFLIEESFYPEEIENDIKSLRKQELKKLIKSIENFY